MLNSPFKLFDAILDQLEPNTLFLEIGSDRGGGSTYYLDNVAQQTKNTFITVDLDPVYLNPSIHAEVMSGEEFVSTKLPKLNKKISLLFLDGFDFIRQPVALRNGNANVEITNMVDEYARKGLTLNNVNSVMTHLQQVMGAVQYMDSKCAVMLCDTWFSHITDTFTGKGSASVYFLLSQGFEILSCSFESDYVLLGRNIRAESELQNIDLSKLSKVYTGPKKRIDAIIYKE
jgi:hypothetical protein